MDWLKRTLRKIPAIETTISFLQQLGFWNWITIAIGSLLAVMSAFWSYLESNLPYWGIGLVALVSGCLVVFLINQLHGMWLRQKSKSIDVPKSAAKIGACVAEMRQTLLQLQAIRPAAANEMNLPHDAARDAFWEKQEQRMREKQSFMNKHSGDVVMCLRLIQTITENASLVRDIVFHSYEPVQLVGYLDAASRLLEAGALEEVKKLTEDRYVALIGH